MDFSWTDSTWFILGVIPALIFLARVTDVTLGTVRLIMIQKGLKWPATGFGFLEVFVWIIAMSQVMKNLDHFINYIAYAGGYAAGTMVGMWVEEKLAMGKMLLRVITSQNPAEMIRHLKASHYGATTVPAQGTEGAVFLVYIIIHRKNYETVAALIQKFHPKAFYSVEDVRLAKEGVFPLLRAGSKGS